MRHLLTRINLLFPLMMKTAFDFTKIIYTEKSKNSLYKNVLVHLSLSPNQNYIKKQKSESKKREYQLKVS